ncbi:hypothetical protein GKE62_14615 [Novosphingobium sp. Gsoil 351]|nr:hypothetical protein GKE62_14615 [Novosphingobium sp. Gsoil 351]
MCAQRRSRAAQSEERGDPDRRGQTACDHPQATSSGRRDDPREHRQRHPERRFRSRRTGPGRGRIWQRPGRGGDGGDGDGINRETPPRPIRDRLAYKYIPDDVGEPGETVSLGVVYIVNPDGHVSNCRVDRTSGYPRFDRLACQLIEERFLFRPARDRSGKAVSTRVGQDHYWEIPRDVDRGR